MKKDQVAAVVLAAIVRHRAVGYRTFVVLKWSSCSDAEIVGFRPPERIPDEDLLEWALIQAFEVEAFVEISRNHLRISSTVNVDFECVGFAAQRRTLAASLL